MRDTMLQVVESGTGKNAYVPGYRVGGKTATSEILKEAEDVEDRYTASFIGVSADGRSADRGAGRDQRPAGIPLRTAAVRSPRRSSGRIMEDVLPYIGVTPVSIPMRKTTAAS